MSSILEDDNHRTISKNTSEPPILVKFAKSKPAISAAEQDRKLVEQIVVKTHDALARAHRGRTCCKTRNIWRNSQEKNSAKEYIGQQLFLLDSSFLGGEAISIGIFWLQRSKGYRFWVSNKRTCWKENGFPVLMVILP